MPDHDPAAAIPPAAPADSGMELTTAQAFELERFGRLLDSIDDVATPRNLAKLLLRSWYAQKAATAWAFRQGLRR
jgi:hypothetical protein